MIYVLPFLISNFGILFLVFNSLIKAYLFSFLVKIIESTWFTWVSQSNHITMEIHTDVYDDTWINLQVNANILYGFKKKIIA